VGFGGVGVIEGVGVSVGISGVKVGVERFCNMTGVLVGPVGTVSFTGWIVASEGGAEVGVMVTPGSNWEASVRKSKPTTL
jgi:hypothetical protein